MKHVRLDDKYEGFIQRPPRRGEPLQLSTYRGTTVNTGIVARTPHFTNGVYKFTTKDGEKHVVEII